MKRAQRRDGVVERRGSVLLKGVRKNFSEFFEKSIDKEEIDAILNSTVRFRSRGCGSQGQSAWRMRIYVGVCRTIPDTRKQRTSYWHYAVGMMLGRRRALQSCVEGCSLKSVE